MGGGPGGASHGLSQNPWSPVRMSQRWSIGLQNQDLRANFDHFWHRKVIFVCFLSVLDVERVFRAHLVHILMHFGAQNDLKRLPKFPKCWFCKPMAGATCGQEKPAAMVYRSSEGRMWGLSSPSAAAVLRFYDCWGHRGWEGLRARFCMLLRKFLILVPWSL